MGPPRVPRGESPASCLRWHSHSWLCAFRRPSAFAPALACPAPEARHKLAQPVWAGKLLSSPLPHRHFERSRPTLSLPHSLPLMRRPADVRNLSSRFFLVQDVWNPSRIPGRRRTSSLSRSRPSHELGSGQRHRRLKSLCPHKGGWSTLNGGHPSARISGVAYLFAFVFEKVGPVFAGTSSRAGRAPQPNKGGEKQWRVASRAKADPSLR